MAVMTWVRYLILTIVGLVALGALAVMAVQRRILNPFGRAARMVRRLTDPALKPIERRVLRAGGNPQSAPWWMLGIAVLGGILAISAAEWLIGETMVLRLALNGGTRSIVFVVVDWTFALLNLALIVRVVGSWLGAGRFNPWVKPFWFMTEWFLAPLRRVIPPLGPVDISPLIAYLLLSFIRPAVLRLL
jgi:YggT family protein